MKICLDPGVTLATYEEAAIAMDWANELRAMDHTAPVAAGAR